MNVSVNISDTTSILVRSLKTTTLKDTSHTDSITDDLLTFTAYSFSSHSGNCMPPISRHVKKNFPV